MLLTLIFHSCWQLLPETGMAQDTCIPRKQQTHPLGFWHSLKWIQQQMWSQTLHTAQILLTGKIWAGWWSNLRFWTASVPVPYLQKKSCPSAPFTSVLSQHLIIILEHIPKWMKSTMWSILKKNSSWKICEWVAMQNRMLAFPLTASFPSSSDFFANFSSISHMRSMKVNIFPHKLVLAWEPALCDFVGKGEKHPSTSGKPNARLW